ncbi:signal peptidase I [Xenorhabdus sp. TH1]|uniref:signal peptidase I n=1 Tax=Xenorhabdus sp. TH1 TaxID=3130166 RepID=UPI0030D49FBA
MYVIAVAVILFETITFFRKKKVHFFSITILACVTLVSIVKFYFLDFYIVPTPSMTPTIRSGDLTLSVPYKESRDTLYRGDVVIFNPPAFPSFVYVKRIVGIAGDTVSFNANKEILVNGKPTGIEKEKNNFNILYEGKQERDGKVYQFTIDRDKPYIAPIYTTWLVPEGYVFVVGDNRDNSWDSRYWENPVGTPKALRGLLPTKYILSRYTQTAINIPFATDNFDFGRLGLNVMGDAKKTEKSKQ